jgi:uncharacterized protein (TIGR00251 family)
LSGASPPLPVRATADGVVLGVRLTPKSSRDEILGIETFGGVSVLKVRVRALPEEGRANDALVKLIAKWLGVPPSTVSVAQGGKSRLKQVRIEGDAETLTARIAARLGVQA